MNKVSADPTYVVAEATVAEVYGALSEELTRFVGARVPAAAVDDLVQEIFLRLHARLVEGATVGHLRGWVYQVARYVIADHYRVAERAEIPVGLEVAPALTPTTPPDDSAGEPSLAAQRDFVAAALGAMIDSLPPADAEALRLVEMEGLSQYALAKRLGLSPSGARSRVQRARARLKAQLEACCALAFDRYGGVLSCTPQQPTCTCALSG